MSNANTRVPAPKVTKEAFYEGDVFGDRLAIPAEIKAEMDARGLVPRWISAKTLGSNNGRHPKGWTPFEMANSIVNAVSGTSDKLYRIGDLILGAKTKEQHAKHAKYLKDKARMQSSESKNRAEEMKANIRDQKGSKYVQVVEGYEDNE